MANITIGNTAYSNFVLQNKATDLLKTALNMKNFMTIDNSLNTNAGLKKTVHTYTYTGTVEKLNKGDENSSIGTVAYTSKDYTVKRVQETFGFNDEDVLADPYILDASLKGATQEMVNEITDDFVGELEGNGVTLEIELGENEKLSYDAIVDAISELNLEDEKDIFVMIPNTWKADLRKDDDYVAAHQGDVVYNGQVGIICGRPVIASKALTNAYVMTKEAVTCFIKKDVSVEEVRDAEHALTKEVMRQYYVVALTDATKVCRIKAQSETSI